MNSEMHGATSREEVRRSASSTIWIRLSGSTFWLAVVILSVALSLALVAIIFLVDPGQTMTTKPSELLASELGSGDLWRDLLVCAIWLTVCTVLAILVAVVSARIIRSDPARSSASLVLQAIAASSGVWGFIFVSATVPATLVGVSLYVQAESIGIADGGSYSTPVLWFAYGVGGVLLGLFFLTGLAAMIAARPSR